MIKEAYKNVGVHSFKEALQWTHKLPYGRNSDRSHYTLIFEEGCGTCSTKHATIAALAKELELSVHLKMVICKLNTKLAPRVGPFLEKLNVDFIPEAHCFINYDGNDIDLTFPEQPPIPKVEILVEHIIAPEEIGEKKLQLHLDYMKKWAMDKPFTFEKAWSVREAWIDELSRKT